MEQESVKSRVCRIESDVSARISTAQVIVSVSGAVRQLIDNSLDASAQTVEIRAKNYGFESVEVSDDGDGIDAESFSSLCKPHSTSKLTGLNDFGNLSTLGFRGEALNALCSLASLIILTKSRCAAIGTRLRFDHCGNIVDQSSTARPTGTTVIVEKLFETLPVRRKEFERTSKKDFAKLLNVVQCFALSRPDVKFVCSNVVDGRRIQPICTPGKVSIREVVTNLFGGRADKNKMINVVRCIPTEDVALMYGLDFKKTSAYEDIEITGFVSSCEHGFGRSSTDRQFIYFNKRPVDYSKICRVVNEVYQQYNRYQYPTLVLYVTVPPNEIDVNVTPDKRVVFFEREKELLALIRSSFLATFHPLLGAYTSVTDKLGSKKDGNTTTVTNAIQLSEPQFVQSVSSLPSGPDSIKSNSVVAPPLLKKRKTFDSTTAKITSIGFKTLDAFAFKPISRDILAKGIDFSQFDVSTKNSTTVKSAIASCSSSKEDRTPYGTPPLTQLRRTFNPSLTRNLSRGFDAVIEKDCVAIENMEKEMDREESTLTSSSGVPTCSSAEVPDLEAEDAAHCIKASQQSYTFPRSQQTVFFSMSALKDRLDRIRQHTEAKNELPSQTMEFAASISPEENNIAEEELGRVLKKTNFAEMSVVGQFNKGFIITRLRDHLFLVDQHASDEKYNFERFQKKARVETQKLLHPKILDLGAVQESVLKDNLAIMEANGFGFEFQEKEDGCSAAMLVSAPVLHSWQFDKNDIEEILAVVSEFPGVMYRPAKLRRIFASRACRKSVMIGTALSKNQMQTIVSHLGTLDNPWNCPHGRPTLRHLADLHSIFE